MPSELAPTVGAMLRTAREQQGLSVNDIAERTRIRSTLIREIESDNFFGCGDTFYARGHVRSIAVTVGLDPADVLAEFDAAQGPAVPELAPQTRPPHEPVRPRAETPPPAPVRPRSTTEPATPRAAPPPVLARPTRQGRQKQQKLQPQRPQKQSPSWMSAMVAAATVIALLAVASFLIGYAQGPPRPKTAGTVPSISPSPRQPSPSPSLPPAGVTVQVRATSGSSWIRVTDGGGTEIYQGVLDSGDVKDFSDPKMLTIRFGNSSVINVVVNGVAKGAPSCGAVVCSETYKLDEPAG